MKYQENLLNYQNIRNGIDQVYSRLLKSDNLSSDLLNGDDNYECFLINQNINHKLSGFLSTIDKNKLIYTPDCAKELLADSQYCEKYFELIKSYLFTIGIDIESKNENQNFNLEIVEKSSEKLKTVISSLKIVAAISIEKKNLDLFDHVFNIYEILYKAYVANSNKLLQQCFFALENTVIETPIFANYRKFCDNLSIETIFNDLEIEISNKSKGQNQVINNINKTTKEEVKITNEEIVNASQANMAVDSRLINDYENILKYGIDDQINALKNNANLDLTKIISIDKESFINNVFSEELVNNILINNYKEKFLNFVNLYFLKVGINIGNNVGLPIASFINKNELRIIISSLKITALFSSKNDEKYFNQLSETYSKLYQKFTQVGLLDNENGISDCFYANEIGNDSKICQYYLAQKPDGIFYEIENEIDTKRFNQLIEANIKKFDEKTIKFYSEPYLDIRLEKSPNNQDYQIQIIFDDQKTSIAEVAKDLGINPNSIENWQIKNIEDGQSLSLSHEETANYLGIAKGEELNQTLLAIRDQARNEQETMSKEYQVNANNISNDYSDSNEDKLLNSDFDNSSINANNGDDFTAFSSEYQKNNLVNAQMSESVNALLPQEVAEKFSLSQSEFKKQQDGVQEIHQYFNDNIEDIDAILKNSVMQKILNFSAINPDLKIETTTNPICETVRHQIKLVFRKGFNQQTQAILASILTEGECKEWQLSQAQESINRGFSGSFIIPHDYSAKMIGVRNPNEVNKAIEDVFNLVANLELFNISLLEYLRNDISFKVLRNLISYNFSLAFDYTENQNIFSKKNLVLIAVNDEERENIYNFLGYSWEQNKNLNREDLLDQRALITDSNGDIVLSKEICASLFGLHRESDIDLTIRRMESFLQANKELCDIFNADEHQSLLYLLDLNNNQAQEQDNEDYSDESEDELKSIFV